MGSDSIMHHRSPSISPNPLLSPFFVGGTGKFGCVPLSLPPCPCPPFSLGSYWEDLGWVISPFFSLPPCLVSFLCSPFFSFSFFLSLCSPLCACTKQRRCFGCQSSSELRGRPYAGGTNGMDDGPQTNKYEYKKRKRERERKKRRNHPT